MADEYTLGFPAFPHQVYLYKDVSDLELWTGRARDRGAASSRRPGSLLRAWRPMLLPLVGRPPWLLAPVRQPVCLLGSASRGSWRCHGPPSNLLPPTPRRPPKPPCLHPATSSQSPSFLPTWDRSFPTCEPLPAGTSPPGGISLTLFGLNLLYLFSH